jgi:hypothetical protein
VGVGQEGGLGDGGGAWGWGGDGKGSVEMGRVLERVRMGCLPQQGPHGPAGYHTYTPSSSYEAAATRLS